MFSFALSLLWIIILLVNNYELFTALIQLNSKKVERVKRTPSHVHEKKALKVTDLYSPPFPF